MNHSNNKEAELLRLYLTGEATAAQAEELFGLLESGGSARLVIGELKQAYSASQHAGDAVDMETTERMHQAIMRKIQSAPQVHRIHLLRTVWFKYAAAILLIITGVVLYQLFSHSSHPETAAVQNVPPASGSDIAPGFNRATLTLSNGQKVILDSAASETITDGTLSIENNNGQLSYKNASVAAMNTMATPKGGQYKLTLSDGTKVWLNAASSIAYPTSFTGKTREVSITGEAYFEVRPNKAKPFIVKTGKEDISVLGTSFNVNAYADEPAMKVSLLEGLVKVGDTNIKPGQAYMDGRIVATDVQQDVAWKNGYFNIQGADIKTVMRSISRWYNVEVVYKREISTKFYVDISRSTTLSDVLKILEATGKVKAVINEKTVIIQ